MQTYEVLAEGWLDNAYRKVGDKVTLTAAQAEYLILAGILGLPKKADKKAS